MDTLHQRLIKSFDYLRDNGIVHTQTQFAEAIGKSQTQINGAFKDAPKRCTLGLMKSIADAYPDILSREYLLTGEGEVAAPDKTMKPHFDAKACAGFMCGVSEPETGRMLPMIAGVRDYDFTIEVEGESMMPRIEPGDLLMCRFLNDRMNTPIGKVCVIGGKESAVVKMIVDADDERVTLHSLNTDPAYRDYTVEHGDIVSIAEVVGLLRRF